MAHLVSLIIPDGGRTNIMKTLVEVKDICKKIMVSQGYDIDLPISINNRFKNTFGRVTINYSSDKVEKVEFAAVLLDSNNDAEIMDTIKHELAHVLVFFSMDKIMDMITLGRISSCLLVVQARFISLKRSFLEKI